MIGGLVQAVPVGLLPGGFLIHDEYLAVGIVLFLHCIRHNQLIE